MSQTKKRSYRILALAICAVLTVMAMAIPLSVFATGWTWCSDGTTDPGDRTGCSVKYDGYMEYYDGRREGFYEYNCSGNTTLCTYQY